jgi:hypothetical protein
VENENFMGTQGLTERHYTPPPSPQDKLLTAAKKLNEIVEGTRNERWAADGKRLKDTPEWCAFYVALNACTR